jgi:hypothetical protein
MFEQQYDEQMAAEIRRLEAKQRARAAGHADGHNACAVCGCELGGEDDRCAPCLAAAAHRPMK